MALADRTEIQAVCIKVDGVLEVRVDRVISDGSEELGRKGVRTVYTPDMDPQTLPSGKIRQLANFVWTPAVVAAYIAAHPAGA